MAATTTPSSLNPLALFVPFVVVLVALIATHAPISSDIAATVAFLGIPAVILALRARHV